MTNPELQVRCEPRVTALGSIEFCVKSEKTRQCTNTKHKGKLINISSNGMCMLSASPVSPEEVITVSDFNWEENVAVDKSYHVKWTDRHDEGFILGCRLNTPVNSNERNHSSNAFDSGSLISNKKHLQAIYENAPIGFAMADMNGNLIASNPVFQRMLGYNSDELRKMTFKDITHKDDWEEDVRRFHEMLQNKRENSHIEKRYIRKDGSTLYANLTVIAVRDKSGIFSYDIGMIEDITDRKQAEAALREAHEEMEKRVVERTESLKQNEDKLRKLLHDKDVLLKEINHRVKNNLQVISSIIRLQSKFTEQCESKTLLKSILNRVTAIAHVHKMLYATGSLSEINIKDYVNTLIHYLSVSYSCSSKIKMRVDVDNVELNTETIIPCGLLINELVSNSINHAFPDNSEGVINISLKKVDDVRLLLSIADNGIGLPDNVDFRDNIRTLGLQLISTMAEGQLNGNIEFVNHKGTRIDVYFRELNYNQRV